MKRGDLVFARGHKFSDSSGNSIVDYCELFREGTSPGDPGDHTFVYDGTPLLIISILSESICFDKSVKTLEVFEFEMGEMWYTFEQDVRKEK